MNIVSATPEGIANAVQIIRSGEIVAYPTETVYGLGVDPCNSNALDRLFRAKGRGGQQAVLLIIDDLAQLAGFVQSIPSRTRLYMEHFWPGPLSLVLPAVPGLPEMLLGNDGRICVRCPASKTARALCRAFGGPITSTSANRSGAPPARAVAELDLDGIALAIDGGVLSDSLPSTVYDPESRLVLREGVIQRDALDSIA